MKIDNKNVVITGGGNGIGRELVIKLLSKGANVAVIDKNSVFLEETRKLCAGMPGKLTTHLVDIADRQAVEELPARVLVEHGSVDVLINDAGIIQPFVRFNDLEYDDIMRVMEVNFFGTMLMTRAFLPHLLERPEGLIVNISSMGGFLPVPGQTIYGASKAAVKLFTEGLASELLNTNVKVMTVFPGAINTNIAFNSGVMDSLVVDEDQANYTMLEPARAAQIIVDGMDKDRRRVLVGSDSSMMDFLTRVSPLQAAKLIYTQMKALLPI